MIALSQDATVVAGLQLVSLMAICGKFPTIVAEGLLVPSKAVDKDPSSS